MSVLEQCCANAAGLWLQVREEGKRGEKCEVASVSEESLDITITSAETDSRVQGHSEARDVEEQRTATSNGRGEPGVDQSTGFEQSEGDVAVESSDGATIHSTDTGRAAVDTGSGVSEDIGCGSSENSTVQTVEGGKCPEEGPAVEHDRHEEPASSAAERDGEDPAIDPPSTVEAGPDSRRGMSGHAASPGRAAVDDQGEEGTPNWSDTGSHTAAVVDKSHRAVQLSNKLMFALD